MTIDDKVRELIAVGASITANCQPCLQYHAKKASDFGADAEEIAEAIDMGMLVRKGAAAKMDTFSSDLKGNVAAESASVTKASGCCS